LNDTLKVGDNVQIPASKAKFEREGQTYSEMVYQVKSVLGSKVEIRNQDGHILKAKYNTNTAKNASAINKILFE
jgi:hypothetical protein